MAGIFKAYDVRGVYGDKLDEALAEKIGRAFARLLGSGKRIVCGRDGRTHSVPLRDALTLGMREGGLRVVDMGLCSTPMTYFAGFSDNFDGSVMVTASHNSGEYNGFKFCRERAIPIGYVEGLDQMETMVTQGSFENAASVGGFSHADYLDPYLEFLANALKVDRRFEFAVDGGNGMGGFVMRPFLEKTGMHAHELYLDMDFSFPNHLANPLDFSTLKDLAAVVRERKLDFGVAFDGDADRCFFVDDTGEVVAADILTTLIAEDMLSSRGPSAIVYDVRSSRVVKEVIEAHGGTPILCRVGHSFMKRKLREQDGWFGGELAGHFYFKDFAFADSAMLTMVTVMNIISKHNKPLSELIRPYQKYVPSGELNFVTEEADQIIAAAESHYDQGRALKIDGLRMDFSNWWFCLRKSNTEPLLRLVVEASDRAVLDDQLGALAEWLESQGAKPHGH